MKIHFDKRQELWTCQESRVTLHSLYSLVLRLLSLVNLCSYQSSLVFHRVSFFNTHSLDSLDSLVCSVYTSLIVRQTTLTQRNVYRFLNMNVFEALRSTLPCLYCTGPVISRLIHSIYNHAVSSESNFYRTAMKFCLFHLRSFNPTVET